METMKEARFQWVPRKYCAKELPISAVHLGVKNGEITYVARRAVSDSNARTYMYGQVVGGRRWDTEVIDSNDYEILLAPKDGYYWVPNTAQLPHNHACMEDARYLARAYEETGIKQGEFYCGLATADTCFYQVQGRIGLSSTGAFEILTRLPSFATDEKQMRRDRYDCAEQLTTEMDTNLLSFGWARWTRRISTRFLVSAGTCLNGTSFVTRSITTHCCLAADSITIDRKTQSIRHNHADRSILTEVLLASPGSYMWVDHEIAMQLYEQESTVDESNNKLHGFLPTWDRSIRHSHDDGISKEWDYRLGRFLGNELYSVGGTTRHFCQALHSGAGRFDTLIFMNWRQALDSNNSPAVFKHPEFTRCIPCGAIGWIPVDAARHLSWAYAISHTEDHERGLEKKAVAGKRMIIIRRTWSSNGEIHSHQIEPMDPLELEGGDGNDGFEVLWGSEGSFSWVADRAGYIPYGAMTGGKTSDGGLFYIGRTKSLDGSIKLGTVFPINMSLSVTGKDGSIERAEEYEVLCVVSTPIATEGAEGISSKGTLLASKKIPWKTTINKAERLVADLRALQRTDLHGEGLYKSEDRIGGVQTYEDKVSSLMHGAGLEILLETSDWIPYVSRLARIHGLPSSIWSLLFRYTESLCSEDTPKQQRLKLRVASILKYAVGGTSRKLKRVEDFYAFIPFLQYLSSTKEHVAGVIFHALEALVTFLTSYEWTNGVERRHLEKLLGSEKLIKFINGCIDKLQVRYRSDFASQLNSAGIKAIAALSDVSTASPSSTVGEKMKKFKRKSLASFTASGGSAPMPNTVVVTQLHTHFLVSSEIASEMEQTAVNEVPHLYRESRDSTLDMSVHEGQGYAAEDANTLWEKFLESHALEHALALCTALSGPWTPPLSPGALIKLQEAITTELSQEIHNAVDWAVVLSLAREEQMCSATELEQVISKLTPMLLTSAAATEDLVLTEAILTVLESASTKLTLGPTDFFHINEILKQTTTNVEGHESRCVMIARIALGILCDNPNLDDNAAASTNAAVMELLRVSPDKAVRIQGTRYFAQVTADHNQGLEEGQLRFLAAVADDQVRDIRIYARTAFANGLWHNQTPGLHAMLADYFPQVFATYPVLLTVPGDPAAAEEFTDKINGPLLDIVDAIAEVPLAFLDGICRLFEYGAHSIKKNTDKTRYVLRKALEQLSKQSGENSPGKLKTAEKLFLKTSNENDDEDLTVECLAYMIKSIEKKRHEKEEYQASRQLLRAISNRMIRRSSPIYPQCLHLLSSIQEIPQDIFFYYHLEIASLRLNSGVQAVQDFLKSHALDGTTGAITCSIIVQHISNHYKRGLLVSSRTVHALLSCLQDQSVQEQANVWSCFLSMANAAYFFKERELSQIFNHANFQGKACKEACIKIIQNQGLSPAALTKLPSLTETLTRDSVEFATSVLGAHQDPPQIASHIVRIGIQAMQRGHQGDNDDLPCKGRKLLLQVIPHISNAQIGELKDAIKRHFCCSLKSTRRIAAETECNSNLELILKLKFCHPQSLTWDEIDSLAATEGSHLLSAPNEAVLSKIHQLWRPLAPVTSPHHIFFTLLSLQFGQDPREVIDPLCRYIRDGSRDVVRDELQLKMHHTDQFQRILQENVWACRRVVEALRQSEMNASHLQQLGNSVFITWSRAWKRDVQEVCEEILRILVQNGWKLDSSKLENDFKLLTRLVGMNNLSIPNLLGQLSTSSNLEADRDTEGAELLAEDYPDLHEYARIFTDRFEVKDLCTKVLCSLNVANIYESLKKAGKAKLMGRLVESIKDGLDSEEKRKGQAHLYLERIRFCINNNPAVLLNFEDGEFARDAQVFCLGSMLHDRYETKTGEPSKIGSFILASQLLIACGEQAGSASIYIAQMKGIRSYEEVSSFIEMVSHLGLDTDVRVIVASPQPVHSLQVELTLQYFWKMLSLCNLDKFPNMRSNLRRLLEDGTLSWNHFSNRILSQTSELSAENLDSFFHLILSLNLNEIKIPVNFLHIHENDWKDSERFLSKVLGKLLTQCYGKGLKESRSIAKELLTLNKNLSFMAEKYTEDSLLKILRQVRGAQNLEKVAPGIPTWSKEKIEQWAKDVKQKLQTVDDTSILEFLAVASRAIQLVKGWRPTAIQILSAYLSLSKQRENIDGQENIDRKFFQVSTGSGKSAIISIVAAAKAFLFNLHVDVHTHNPLLAKRDAEEWSEFYRLFQIRCSHNIEESLGTSDYVKGKKRCYASQVVYGDTKQFQFDALRSEYLDLETRGGRYYECAIVDEVDSIYIDDAEKLTILSSPIAGMELLQPLYHRIWEEACTLNDSTNLVQIGQDYFTYEGTFETNEAGSKCTYRFNDSMYTEEELLDMVSQANGKEELVTIGLHDRRTLLTCKLISCIRGFLGHEDHTSNPSDAPSSNPSDAPSSNPSDAPSSNPSDAPSSIPSDTPSSIPSDTPSSHPSDALPSNPSDTSSSNTNDAPQQPQLSIPKNLERFVQSQVENWAASALKALALAVEKDYVIIDSTTIAPLDPNNAVTMELSSWSNGLHQFLQMKHGLEFNPESLQTAYLSNKAMMEKYEKGELIGFSGTLHDTEDFFLRVFNIRVVKIPDLHHRCFCQFPAIISNSKNEWMAQIATSLEEQTKNNRAVLAICKSINSARKLKHEIERRAALKHAGIQQRIFLHVRSDADEDRVGPVEDWKAEPGDVIITTLLGARGMDIKGGEIEAYGGLHVILTFLLPNKRLEAQALGRAARQGNYGSAQYILKVSLSDCKAQNFQTILVQRETQQCKYLESLEKVIYNMTTSKDKAFQDYVLAFRHLYQNLAKKDLTSQIKLGTLGYTFSESDWTLLDAYQEYWAIHLATTINRIVGQEGGSSGHPISAHQKLHNALMQFVKPRDMAGSENETSVDASDPKSIFGLTQSCFLATRFAFHYYSENKFLPFLETRTKAEKYFQRAIEMDRNHAAGAHVGLAYFALLGDKLFYKFPTHVEGYKGAALIHLQKAFEIVTLEVTALQGITCPKSMIENPQSQKFQSPYEIQLNERLEVLKRYAGVLLSTQDFVKNTQRPVYITSSSGEPLPTHAFAEVPTSLSSSDSKTRFALTCNGLRWKKDTKKDHEVERAVSALNKSRQVTITLLL